MDLSRLEFPVLDLKAKLAFRTAASASFDLGRDLAHSTISWGDSRPGEDITIDIGPVFEAAGRLDVHHPCDDHIKAHLLVTLPVEYHSRERMREFVATVFEALGIPADETYKVNYLSPKHGVCYIQPEDRDGVTDWV